MEKSIKIGLFGLGTVGQGVISQLLENKNLIKKRLGREIEVVKAVVLNPKKEREVALDNIKISDNIDDILNDPEIDIVVELIGGLQTAKDIIIKSLNDNKSVVTANKALLAEHSEEIFDAAYKSKGLLGYEASVAGGIPIIRNIKEGFSGDKIIEISGIINGTANYILTSMSENNADFADALAEAQEKGFAEADPTFDIEGQDSAHKLVILMDLAFNALFDYNSVYIEGISEIEAEDIEIAKEFNYSIKLLGKAKNTEKGYEGRVHPAMVKNDSILSSVNGAFNAVYVEGNFVGPTISYGAGAGSHPTASAVLGDIIQISRGLLTKQQNSLPPLSYPIEHLKKKELINIEELITEYYLRFTLLDKVGVLAEITRLLGSNNISIRCMVQKTKTHKPELPVSVIIFTHQAQEIDIKNALNEIDKLPFVTNKTKLIRVDS